MARIRVEHERLPEVMEEAHRIVKRLLQDGVPANEAAKALQFYMASGTDEELLRRYLSYMATKEDPRSRNTPGYYRSLTTIWRDTGRALSRDEKAYAWAWAVRLAQAEKRAQNKTQGPRGHSGHPHRRGDRSGRWASR